MTDCVSLFTFHCMPLLFEHCWQSAVWPYLLWPRVQQIACYLPNASHSHGSHVCVWTTGNGQIWLSRNNTQAHKPCAVLGNKHQMMAITVWHHTAEISRLHPHTVTPDRQGSDNTATSVHPSCVAVCILKSELCPCTVMKKAQLEEWIFSLRNK